LVSVADLSLEDLCETFQAKETGADILNPKELQQTVRTRTSETFIEE
jgi:hypothetical protein